MKLLFIGNEWENQTLRRALDFTGDDAVFLSSRALTNSNNLHSFDAALVSRDHGHHGELLGKEALERIPLVGPIGLENLKAGISTLTMDQERRINEYANSPCFENLVGLIHYVRHLLLSTPCPDEPIQVPFDGIYSEHGIDTSFEDFIQRDNSEFTDFVGIIQYRSRYLGGDTQIETALEEAFNARGIGVIKVFTTARSDLELGSLSMTEAIEKFLPISEKYRIHCFINFLAFGSAEGTEDSLFDRLVSYYQKRNLPVIRPLVSNSQTAFDWENSSGATSIEQTLFYDIPELMGLIEPVMIGVKNGSKSHDPIPDRIERLCDRVANIIRLRNTKNSQKKLAIVLNSPVCSGIEATLGKASGLLTFDSVVSFLRLLEKEHYDVSGFPQTGQALKELILERKAFSDFRWTSVEDIVDSMGDLYQMDLEEYQKHFSLLPKSSQSKMINSWSIPPGEAMVLNGKIVITGLRFGNVYLLIQPKRGCFGAKCTGEVCKILQDPSTPCTHQYFATYRYLETQGVHAVIHFGTHGSLEYLPGKQSMLSSSCFSDQTIGSLPHFYLVNSSSIPSALLAKRRSYATLIDHIPTDGALHELNENELKSLVEALNGSYIKPGPGGGVEDLPFQTGTNIYALRADKIPTREAYLKGEMIAQKLLDQHLEETGKYPNKLAINLIALDITRTGGEQISTMLALMGIRPEYDLNGTVIGLKEIPEDQLIHPRMDVTTTISSLFRDIWPTMIDLLDEAIILCASLDEADENNFLKKNLKSQKNKEIHRIFGGRPGTYTNSIGLALKASAWNDETDLASYFIDSNSFSYGRYGKGNQRPDCFIENIQKIETCFDIKSADSSDQLKSSYSSRMLGGIAIAKESMGLQRSQSLIVENSKGLIAIKTLQQHVKDGLKRTLLNEDWLKDQKAQNYYGASEIMNRIQNLFDMQCIHEDFSNDELDEVVKSVLLNKDFQDWFRQENPFAYEESNRRFLELHDRNKWSGDEDVLSRLKHAYLKVEGDLEDTMNGMGEVQGGTVEIVSYEQVTEWNERISELKKELF
ncbi:cobaltochelatase subunit CobN [Guggenheimella bovis]